MPFKIKNWKLTLIAVVFIAFLSSLGFWQLARAKQKRILLTLFAQRMTQTPLSSAILTPTTTKLDLRYYRAKLTGHFDNQHTFLLDNTIFHQHVGYEVYSPFYVDHFKSPILIDRGFIPIINRRQENPAITPISGEVTIIGMLTLPPTYVALGKINAFPQLDWPLRVEYINVSELKPFLGTDIFAYTLRMDPQDKRAYPLEWQIVTFGPERHVGYAVQWFALALTLLIIFVVLNYKACKQGAST